MAIQTREQFNEAMKSYIGKDSSTYVFVAGIIGQYKTPCAFHDYIQPSPESDSPCQKTIKAMQEKGEHNLPNVTTKGAVYPGDNEAQQELSAFCFDCPAFATTRLALSRILDNYLEAVRLLG